MCQAIQDAIAAIEARGRKDHEAKLAREATNAADRRLQFLERVIAKNTIGSVAYGTRGGMQTFEYLDSAAHARRLRAIALVKARKCQIDKHQPFAKTWLQDAAKLRRTEVKRALREQAALGLAALDAALANLSQPLPSNSPMVAA